MNSRTTDLRGGGVETRAQTRYEPDKASVGTARAKAADEPRKSRVSVLPASPLFATLKANQQRLSTALSTLANLCGWVALLALAFGYVAFIDLMVN